MRYSRPVRLVRGLMVLREQPELHDLLGNRERALAGVVFQGIDELI